MPDIKTLDMTRVKELSEVLRKAMEDYATTHEHSITGAEMGHAMLMFMFECGRQSGLDATIIMAITSPQQPQSSTPVAEA